MQANLTDDGAVSRNMVLNSSDVSEANDHDHES